MLARSDGISIACPREPRLKRYIVQTSSLTTGFIGLNSRELSSPWREKSAKTPFSQAPMGIEVPLHPAPLFQLDPLPLGFWKWLTIPSKCH